MGILLLLLGLAFLIGPHLAAANRPARAAAVARVGEGPYRLAFAAVTILGLVLIAYGFGLYRETEWVSLWFPPGWMRYAAVALMWPACVLVVAAYMPGHIQRCAKHPMLAGVKLWATAHLFANGDLGSVLLFGAILAWAVWTRIALKRREAANPHGVDAPQGTDVVPAGWGADIGAVAVGTLVYLALGFTFHPLVIGVPAFAA